MRVNHTKFIDWLKDLPRRLKRALRPAFVSALAGLVAWPVSYYVLGHSLPLFAMIAAVACLAPGVPNHGSQSLMIVLGVAIGVFCGEMILLLGQQALFVSIPLATFVAMSVAASFGFKPVVSTQAAVSSVLILSFGPQTAGLNRFLDVLVGASVALIFSQVIFTPDPVSGLTKARDNLLERLLTAFQHSRQGLIEKQASTARLGTNVMVNAHQHLVVFDDTIASALRNTPWSIRGRLRLPLVKSLARHYDRRAIRLYAAAVLLCESVGDGLRSFQAGEASEPPELLCEEIEKVMAEVRQFMSKDFQAVLFHEIAPLQVMGKGYEVWWHCYKRICDVQAVLRRITSEPPEQSK